MIRNQRSCYWFAFELFIGMQVRFVVLNSLECVSVSGLLVSCFTKDNQPILNERIRRVLQEKWRLGTAGNARARIAQELHGTATGSHSGILASYNLRELIGTLSN